MLLLAILTLLHTRRRVDSAWQPQAPTAVPAVERRKLRHLGTRSVAVLHAISILREPHIASMRSSCVAKSKPGPIMHLALSDWGIWSPLDPPRLQNFEVQNGAKWRNGRTGRISIKFLQNELSGSGLTTCMGSQAYHT